MQTDLRFHYSATEDRIAVAVTDAGGGGTVLWITRRLTGRFLDALAGFISRTGPGALAAPGHAPEVLGFEHENAVVQAGGESSFKPVPSRLRVDPAALLVESVSLTPLKDGLARLTLRSRQRQVAVNLTREALHLVYHQMHGLAEHAGWRLDLKVPWDSPGTTGGGPPVMH
jgi:hypothetical protein